MLKQPDPTLHKTTRTEITSLFGQAKLVLDETPKAISPFGGLASFISFPGQIGFAQEVPRRRPFAEPTSNNAIPLAHSLHRLPDVRGGRPRSASPTANGCRADRVLHTLPGLERFPSHDTHPQLLSPLHARSHRGVLASALALALAVGEVSGGGLRAGPGFDGVLPRGTTGRRPQGVQ